MRIDNNSAKKKAVEYNKSFDGMFLRTVVLGTRRNTLNLPDKTKELWYKEFGEKPFYKYAEDPLQLDLNTHKSDKHAKVCVSTVRSHSLAWNEGNVAVLMGFASFEKLFDKDQHSKADFNNPQQRTTDSEESSEQLFGSEIDSHDEGWIDYSEAKIVAAAVPNELYRDSETIAILKQYNPKIKVITLTRFNQLFGGEEIISFLYQLKNNQRFEESAICFKKLVIEVIDK